MCISAAHGQSFEVAENGLPILNSKPGALSVAYMDFDGGPGLGDKEREPYGGDLIFDDTEQQEIYRAWRDVSVHFAMLDINVTTVAPDKTLNPTSHLIITPSVSGGAANTGRHGDTAGHARANVSSDHATSRTTGISHEFGHVLGLQHQAIFDDNGTLLDRYRNVDEWNRTPLMGIDYAGGHYAHWADGPDPSGSYQDDIALMVQMIVSKNLEFSDGGYGGDGFAPDDHAPELTSATPLALTLGARAAGVLKLESQTTGTIERYTDADALSLEWPGGPLTLSVEAVRSMASRQTYASSVGLNLVATNAAGQQVGVDLAVDPADVDAVLNLDLNSDTYAFHITGAGGIGDLGAYEVLLTGDAVDGKVLFQNAATAAGLVGGDAEPDAAPFDDGLENLIKFAFNLNLATADWASMVPGGHRGLPVVSWLEVDGQRLTEIEFVRRKRGGLIYRPEISPTLKTGDFMPLIGTRTYEDIDADWQRVRLRHPIQPDSDPMAFIRVRVELP